MNIQTIEIEPFNADETIIIVQFSFLKQNKNYNKNQNVQVLKAEEDQNNNGLTSCVPYNSISFENNGCGSLFINDVDKEFVPK
jgi:hypothetical protein